MIKIIIRSDQVKKNKDAQIFIRYTYQRKYILFSTGIYTTEKDFVNEKIKKSDANFDLKNKLIEKKKNEIEKTILELKLKGIEPTLNEVKTNHFNPQLINTTPLQIEPLKTHPIPIQTDFFIQYENMIKEKKGLNEYSVGNCKNHEWTIGTLKKYSKSENIPINYDIINKDFIETLTIYLYNKGLTDNSVDNTIKNLKTFMNFSKEKGLHSNTDFIYIHRKRRNGDIITLTENEIIKILTYEPTEDLLKRVKDIFILGISTGLRFSDIKNLKTNNFILEKDRDGNIDYEKSFIELTIQKTQLTKHRIPINRQIEYLLIKYDIPNKPIDFNNIPIIEFNTQFKTLCKDAGINQIIKITKWQGNKPIIEEKEKWEFITSHIMRKSFISYSLENNTTESVMSITGHKDYRSLLRYVNMSVESKRDVVNGMDKPMEKSLFEKDFNKLKKTFEVSKEKGRIEMVKLLNKQKDPAKYGLFIDDLINSIKDKEQNEKLLNDMRETWKKILTERNKK